MPLGFVNFVKLGFVSDRLDTFLQRKQVIVVGHDGNGLILKTLGEVHSADRNAPLRLLKPF